MDSSQTHPSDIRQVHPSSTAVKNGCQVDAPVWQIGTSYVAQDLCRTHLTREKDAGSLR